MEWVDEHGSRIVRNWESSLPGNPFFLNAPGVVRVLGHYGMIRVLQKADGSQSVDEVWSCDFVHD